MGLNLSKYPLEEREEVLYEYEKCSAELEVAKFKFKHSRRVFIIMVLITMYQCLIYHFNIYLALGLAFITICMFFFTRYYFRLSSKLEVDKWWYEAPDDEIQKHVDAVISGDTKNTDCQVRELTFAEKIYKFFSF